MQQGSYGKCGRVLDLYTRFLEGEVIRKREAAEFYRINERSIQRDIDDIRAFLDDRRVFESKDDRRIEYDRIRKGFVMRGSSR